EPVQLVHWGDIPADPSVREAVMRRQLLLQSMPGAPASLAVAQLSNKIKASLTANA
ncbi:MAG: MinD/ParA family protein, partial [Comamonas sp.]